MTPNPITIEKDADLAEAAKIMVKHGISGLPVIELSVNAVEPIGIISKFDIIKALSRQGRRRAGRMKLKRYWYSLIKL